jgi:hypothetical protein
VNPPPGTCRTSRRNRLIPPMTGVIAEAQGYYGSDGKVHCYSFLSGAGTPANSQPMQRNRPGTPSSWRQPNFEAYTAMHSVRNTMN